MSPLATRATSRQCLCAPWVLRAHPYRFPDMAYQLKETGLFGAFHGLESLHPDASNAVGKGWSGRHAREFIPKLYHDMWESKIPQTLSFIIGLPNDTVLSIASTVDWFLSNNLHSMKFETLGLRKTLIRNPSEFEKDSAKYGYQFDKDDNWYLDYISHKEAMQYTKVFTNLLAPHVKVSTWQILSMLGTLKIDKTQLIKTNHSKFDWGWIRKKRRIFLEKYKQSLIEL